jgi:hypothetical protein
MSVMVVEQPCSCGGTTFHHKTNSGLPCPKRDAVLSSERKIAEVKADALTHNWKITVTPIRSANEDGIVDDLVMIVMSREGAKQLLKAAGLELGDVPKYQPMGAR